MSNLFGEEAALDQENVVSRETSGDEIFSAQTGNIGTRTRVTSRRVTNSNRVSTSSGSEVTLMHTFSMTTTRSWSGPRIDGSAIDNNGHAVFGLDLINAIPASSDLFGWVNDLDTFIKDHNIGLDETQIRSKNTRATNESGHNEFADATVVSTLRNEASKESDQHPAHNKGASGAELFGIVHAHSLSQFNLNLEIKQAEAQQ